MGVYAPNLGDYFLGDDFDLIASFWGKPPSYFLHLLVDNASGDVWKSLGLDAAQGRGFLRPVHIWLLKLDSLIWGMRPVGFHLTATLAAVAVVLLVFLIAEELGAAPSTAFLGASIVAMHPILSAIVPFIAAREETLTTALCLGAFYAFLRLRLRHASPVPVLVCYSLALLTKETAVAWIGLPFAYDAVCGTFLGKGREEIRRVAGLYGGLLSLLALYLSLRWLAFGNVVGGDGAPTTFGSPSAFVHFHARFWRDLLGPRLLDVRGVHTVRWLVVGTAVSVLFLALIGGSAERALLRRRWFVLGPCWYLITTALFHGTYYDDRHHSLPLVGLALAGATAVEGAVRRLTDRWRAACVGAALIAATILLLPATLRAVYVFHEASRVTERARAAIEALTRELPDGSAVLLVGTPLQEDPPFYFGWGLTSALKRPFTPSDAAVRLKIVDRRSQELNRSRVAARNRFDLKIRFAREPLGSVDRVWRP